MCHRTDPPAHRIDGAHLLPKSGSSPLSGVTNQPGGAIPCLRLLPAALAACLLAVTAIAQTPDPTNRIRSSIAEVQGPDDDHCNG